MFCIQARQRFSEALADSKAVDRSPKSFEFSRLGLRAGMGREMCGRGAIFHAKFRVDSLQMLFDRGRRQIKDFRDFAIRFSKAKPVKHFAFAPRQNTVFAA